MKHLIQQFTAHPVGQGLFYSGMINIKDDSQHPGIPPFNFVFDCGSLNRANAADEIAHYRNHRLPNGTDLDLLVISHFDADHVSHINELLAGPKRVKKVVLPFAKLEERLYLVLKYITQRGRGRQGSDSPIGFMLDPLGSLGDYLDGDSTIYIANSSTPDNPFDGPGEQDLNVSDDLESGSQNFEFGIPGAVSVALADNPFVLSGTQISAKVMKFNDSVKGFLNYRGRRTAIMEFLFYRRDLGVQNDAFFKVVYKAFLKKYRLKPSTPLDKLIEVVKGIRRATEIERIFEDAKEAFQGIDPLGRDIADLNTTALCMLHYNLRSIYTLCHPEHNWIEKDITVIKKFDGTNRTRVEDPGHGFYPSRYHWHPDHPPVHFPNCLLTSDNFLRTTDEVNGLYRKYQHYLELFWLFQIPHHGSQYSAGLELLNRLPSATQLTKFINHGAKKIRRWQHPSPQLINDLVAAGQSVNVLPVNEFTGLRFEVNCRP